MSADPLADFFATPPPPTKVGAQPPSRLNYSHDGMIDLILANPGISQNEIAHKLGYTASWVSTVFSTDVFKAALEKRRKELIDPAVAASMQERFEGVARRALEVIEEKLSLPTVAITENFALRSLEIASRAAGYGARVEAPPSSPVEVHVHLEEMKSNLTRLLSRAREPEPLEQRALPAPGVES